MTREIKFRGKDIKTGEWLYVDLRNKESVTEAFIATIHRCNVKINPITVGQFTGLLDKNGKEIYEGDIVRKKEIGGYGYEYIGVVRYYKKDCRFGIDLTATDKFSKRGLFTDGEVRENDGYCTITYTLEYEVLGNVFDHPGLLKAETL